jgi:Holliday junction resolvase RusA-like endonuclease
VIKFQIKARPQPKERPYLIRGNKRRTPPRTINFELTVAMEFRAQHPFHELFTGPVGMFVDIQFRRPKTVAKGYWHTNPGDASNVVKAIEDGLNRVAWVDDRQVADLHAKKHWGDSDRIVVSIWPLEE